MRKPTLFFLVALVAGMAALGGQAAMACAPGQPPVPAYCHIPTNEGGIRDGTCSCAYGVATKAGVSSYWAWFDLQPSAGHSGWVRRIEEGPTDWVSNYTGWVDATDWTQEFTLTLGVPDLICTATAQPGGGDFVAAAVVVNEDPTVVVRERWSGGSAHNFYSDPVEVTCRTEAQ